MNTFEPSVFIPPEAHRVMIYLVRHGQTMFNAAGRWQGQLDSALTELGKEQAARMGATLRDLVDPTDVTLFSSPLGRARDTAEIIAAALGMKGCITLDPRLMEIGMGSWDGLTDYEIEQEWPNARDGIDRHEWFVHSPDGENYGQVADRLGLALRDIIAVETGSKIIISHGVAGRVLRGLYAGLDKAAALRLEVPQDALFRQTGGKVERIAASA